MDNRNEAPKAPVSNGKRAATKRTRKSLDAVPVTPASKPSDSNRLGLFNVDHLNNLIEHLKKNGFDGDYQALTHIIPGSTEGTIKSFFGQLSRSGPEPGTGNDKEAPNEWLRARKKNAKAALKPAPIEEWIAMVREIVEVQRLGSNPSLMAEWIANFEEHPDPASCCGVDYKSIYLYIAALLEGNIPKQLDPPTASKLFMLFEKLVEIIGTSAKESQDLLLKTAKLPGTSSKLPRDEKNRILRERRRAEWTETELQEAETIKGEDLEAIKKIYCDKPGLNPFSFPSTI